MIRLPIEFSDVDHGAPRHEMIISRGALRGQFGTLVRDAVDASALFLAMDERIVETHGGAAAEALRSAGFEVVLHELSATERAKSLRAVEQMHNAMLGAQLDRQCAVVALGGGIVTDTAGFAAATFMRGVTLVNVPTTLLGMVDAAIGGKTGVNVPLPVTDGLGETASLGKNLIGAFWQPRLIVADPGALRTLEARELRCGLAECIKHAMIADPDLLYAIDAVADRLGAAGETDVTCITSADEEVDAFIARCASVKIAVIRDDVRERGGRALLNLGHTFAHAFESCPALNLRHGEAVAIGLCAAARCAVQTGRMEADDAARIEHVIARCGLPTRLPGSGSVQHGAELPAVPCSADQLLRAMRHDKKVAGGQLRLVLPIGIGRAEVVSNVEPSTIHDVLAYVGAAVE